MPNNAINADRQKRRSFVTALLPAGYGERYVDGREIIMKLPVIINIDSQYDWTSEVQDIWDAIDCKNLHQNFPKIDERDFDFRLTKKLVIISLCSPSFIDRSYNKRGNCNETERDTDSWIHREEENWQALQVGQERNVRDFNGEEPHFRHPKTCENYIIEPYGIYTDDCSILLSGVVDMDKLPLGAKGGAGIFLCPERIVQIYPTLNHITTASTRTGNSATLHCQPVMRGVRQPKLWPLL